MRMPARLSGLVSIDHAAECRPDSVGMSSADIERIWTAVERWYRTGQNPAITLVMRRRGQVVMKRAIGALRGNGPGEHGPLEPLSPDAPICLFSASKSISALLIHKLVDDGRLRLDDRVCHYIPEFAARGKDHVTIRELLAHRAGIPSIPVRNPDAELLLDWDRLVSLLCAAKPTYEGFQAQAYHALTAGYIAGELVRRVSGMDLRDALRQWIAEPLGCRYLGYGLAPALRAESPKHHLVGPRPIWPLSAFIQRILGVGFERAVELSNSPAFHEAIIPAGNIYASADDASRVFQMLLDGGRWNGRQLLSPQVVEEARRPAGPLRFDGMLAAPLRFSPAFILGESPLGLYGLDCKEAFGHLGFLNVICWADPRRELSVALLTTGKSIHPAGVVRLAALLGTISAVVEPD